MNMKKFVKKPLAIAVLMLASGGMVNMVHAEPTVINSKDISATKTVKEGGSFSVEFKATENEIVSGKLDADTPAFHLVMSDSGEHKGWNVRPTGASEEDRWFLQMVPELTYIQMSYRGITTTGG